MKKLLSIAVLAIVISGCASAGGWFNDSNTNARILTKGIVSEYLVHNKTSIQTVYDVTTDALGYVKAGSVGVDQLEVFIISRIRPSLATLTPEAQAAVMVFIAELKAQLVQQLPANNLDPSKTQIEIVTFLTWINDVATTYKNSGMGNAQ